MRLYQVRARNFTAGLIFDDNDLCVKAAPILRKILDFRVCTSLPLWQVEALCFAKGWKLIEVETFEEVVEQ